MKRIRQETLQEISGMLQESLRVEVGSSDESAHILRGEVRVPDGVPPT